MYEDDIYRFASGALGGAETEDVLTALCQAAAGELLSRLREGVDVESIRGSFVTAAGLLALSLYMVAEGSGGVSAFRAGELSVSYGGGRKASADSLRRQAETILAAYLQDQGFAFQGVKG